MSACDLRYVLLGVWDSDQCKNYLGSMIFFIQEMILKSKLLKVPAEMFFIGNTQNTKKLKEISTFYPVKFRGYYQTKKQFEAEEGVGLNDCWPYSSGDVLSTGASPL